MKKKFSKQLVIIPTTSFNPLDTMGIFLNKQNFFISA